MNELSLHESKKKQSKYFIFSDQYIYYLWVHNPAGRLNFIHKTSKNFQQLKSSRKLGFSLQLALIFMLAKTYNSAKTGNELKRGNDFSLFDKCQQTSTSKINIYVATCKSFHVRSKRRNIIKSSEELWNHDIIDEYFALKRRFVLYVFKEWLSPLYS